MKKILLIPNPIKDKGFRVARRVIHQLKRQGADVYIDKKFTDLIWEEAITYNDPPTDVDLCVVMGGDGSILDAAPFAIEHDIPIVGINLGRMGYLSEIEPDRLVLLDRLFRKNIKTVKRLLLSVTVRRADGTLHSDYRFAVNDVVICHDKNFGITDIAMVDSTGNSINYRADGVIVSTPAGSSAYSLSAGGPLVDAAVEAVCVTPICAHSFFNRSILFSTSSSVTFSNNSDRGQELSICIDGRVCDKLLPGDEIQISASEKRLQMVHFFDNGMLNTLQRKMEAAELKHEHQ